MGPRVSNQPKDDWGDPIPPLDYQASRPNQRPPLAASFGVFFLAIVLGCLFTYGFVHWVNSINFTSSVLPYGSLIIKIAACIVLIARPGYPRSAGLGILVSIPLGVLIFVCVLCGLIA